MQDVGYGQGYNTGYAEGDPAQRHAPPFTAGHVPVANPLVRLSFNY